VKAASRASRRRKRTNNDFGTEANDARFRAARPKQGLEIVAVILRL
jgi:hypothetical protein